MSRRPYLAALLFSLTALPSLAQVTDRSGVSNILGAGARALGMAGAFTAIADDATAATWNPAGLQILSKPEGSLVYQYYDSSVTTLFDFAFRNEDGSTLRLSTDDDIASTADAGILFASFTLPVEWRGRRIVSQASYRRLVSFPGTDNPFTFRDVTLSPSGEILSSSQQTFRFNTSDAGGIDDFSVSAATRLFRTLDVGVSVNYMKADSEFRDFLQAVNPLPNFREDNTVHLSFDGLRFDVGLLYRINDYVSVGGVYHTGMTADLDYRTETRVFTPELGDSGPNFTSDQTTLHWPSGYAVGVAFKPISQLTLAADYAETKWSEAKLDSFEVSLVRVDPDGYFVAPFRFEEPGFPTLSEQFDTSSIRAGLEYIFLNRYDVNVPIRMGYFEEDQLSVAAGSDQPTYHGITLGTGFGYKNVQVDFAYIRTIGEERPTGDYDLGVVELASEFQSERFLASIIFRFD